MTADETRMKAAFIQWDIPPKKQVDLSPIYMNGEAARMDSKHVTFTALGLAAARLFNGWEFSYYAHENPTACCLFKEYKEETETVAIDRSILIKILQNMDSDYVKLRVRTDAPLRILGKIGNKNAGAAIAPRIDCKEEEEDETDSL